MLRSTVLHRRKATRILIKAQKTGWNVQSVFGWFDANLDVLLESPSLVICDDMGTESADFIALDRGESRVVLIHCKARKTRGIYGASALHEVCGQAVKNCGMLNLFNPLRPPNAKRWHQPWSSNAVDGTVQSRVRRGGTGSRDNGLGDRLWAKMEGRIRDS